MIFQVFLRVKRQFLSIFPYSVYSYALKVFKNIPFFKENKVNLILIHHQTAVFGLKNALFMGIPHFVIKNWKYYIYCGKITPKVYFFNSK